MRKRAQGRIADGQPKNSGLDVRMNAPAWYRCALSKSGDAEGLFCCAESRDGYVLLEGEYAWPVVGVGFAFIGQSFDL